MGDELKATKGGAVPPVAMLPTGDEIVGGDGAGGDVLVRDADNVPRIVLDAGGPEQRLMYAQTGVTRVYVSGGEGKIRAGGADTDGALLLQRASGDTTLALLATDGPMAGLWAGNGGRNGWVVLRDSSGGNRLWLDGAKGELTVFGGADNPTIRLNGAGGSGWFGGHGARGDLQLFAASNTAPTAENASASLKGDDGSLTLRSADGQSTAELLGADGSLNLRKGGKTTIRLRGEGASGWFGGRGEHGDLLLFPASVDEPATGNASVWIQGETGDIVLRNADCAEEFDVRVEPGVGPGSVLVLDDDGQLVLCREAYDCRVAGVVSGAAGVRPGIVLGRVPGAEDRLPVALAGKVVCNVDASYGPIRVGSLLTTSPRPGYAMVASDRDRAFGAVIGKAMAPLASGLGAVPMLVGLQ